MDDADYCNLAYFAGIIQHHSNALIQIFVLKYHMHKWHLFIELVLECLLHRIHVC